MTTPNISSESVILKPTRSSLPFALIGFNLGPIASKNVLSGIFFACSAETLYSKTGDILSDISYASDK